MSDAKLIIKPPHMAVRMKPGFWPDLARMQQTIHDAGYKPIEGGVALRVTGKLVKQGDGLALELDEMKSPVTLSLQPSTEAPQLLGQLDSRLGDRVELEGQWQPSPSGAGTLLPNILVPANTRGNK